MTKLPPELEALMPEPIRAFRDKGTFTLEEDLFTADQVRQAMLDATERAAKKVPTNWCDSMLTGPDKVPGIDEVAGNTIEALLLRIAAAIRGDGGQAS